MTRFPQPSNEDEFEEFCLRLLRDHWQQPTLDRYGRRGQRQHGVDLYDFSGHSPKRAVQCKHHMLDSILPSGELTAEIQKTETFPAEIQEYYFLTTAKRDSGTQGEYLAICESQRLAGRFSVILWTWEEIERQLDTSAHLEQYLPGNFRGAWSAMASLLPALLQRRGEPALHDAEIDEARALLQARKPDEARVLLERQMRRNWDGLSSRQKYRILANLGTACFYLGNSRSASEYYIRAGDQLPDDNDAQAFKAHGLELAGRTVDAFTLALNLVQQQRNKRALGTAIRSAPKDIPTEQLARDLGELSEEYEAAVHLCVRAMNEQAFSLSKTYAAILIKNYADAPDGHALFGQCILQEELAKFRKSDANNTIDHNGLLQAECALTRGIEINKTLGDLPLIQSGLSDQYFARHQVRFLLGRKQESDSDLEEAWRRAPNEPSVLIGKALTIRKHNPELAIKYLESAIERGADDRARLLCGEILIASGHLKPGIDILSVVAKGGSVFAMDAILRIVDALIEHQRVDDAQEFLVGANLSSCARSTLAGRIEFARKNRDSAVTKAMEAVGTLGEELRADVRMALAHLLQELKLSNQAFTVWESFVVRDVDSPDFKNFLQCAYLVGRHDLVLDACVRARKQGVRQRFYVSLECHLLQLYDPEHAYHRLKEALEDFPNDIEFSVLCAYVALRTDRHDEASALLDPARLPDPSTVSTENAQLVASALLRLGRRSDAVDYVYCVVRNHWGDPGAHQLYVSVLMASPDTRDGQPAVVEVNTVVGYRQNENDSPLVWLVIEGGQLVVPTLGEVAPDSSLGMAFLGKAVGYEFALSGGIQPRIVKIQSIQNKYSYLLSKIMEEYVERFPDSQAIQSLKLPDDPEALLSVGSPLVRAAVERKHYVESILEAHRNGVLPLAKLSELLGQDPIQCQMDIARSKDGLIKCSLPKEEQQEIARLALKTRNMIIVDTSAMATAILVGLLEDMDTWPWEMATTFASREVLCAFTRNIQESRGSGMLGLVSGTVTIVTRDDDAVNRLAETAEKLLGKLPAIDSLPLASITPAVRTQLEQLLSRWGAEAVACGSIDGRVLWTDDVAVAACVTRQGGIAISTQMLSAAALSRNVMTADREEEISIALFVYNYEPLNLPDSLVRSMAMRSRWQFTSSPLSVLLSRMSDVVASAWLRIARLLIMEFMNHLELEQSREAAVVAVLETAGSRRDRAALAQALARSARGMFSLNVVAEQEFKEMLAAWYAQCAR